MEITNLRKGSQGITGTYNNANHHATKLLPIISAIVPILTHFEHIKTWMQGNNIHRIITEDGRRFLFRPVNKDGNYIGIAFLLEVSRSKEIILMTCKSVKRVPVFMEAIRLITKAAPESVRYETDSKE